MGYVISGSARVTSESVMLHAAQAATGFEAAGISPGDTIAIYLRNDPAFLEANLGASMIGAYPVALNWHSTIAEASYLLGDCAAKALIIHSDLLPGIREAIPAHVRIFVVPTSSELRASYRLPDSAGTEIPADAVTWGPWLAGFAPRPVTGSVPLTTMIYTSGTTGLPKGVRRLPPTPEQTRAIAAVLARCYGFADYLGDPSSITTMVTGPMYHSAPNAYSGIGLRLGANVIIAPRFDAEDLLRSVEQYRITHLHMVPIMFVRLLRLSEEVKRRYDLSSLRYVVHAAAPCPAPVKRAMIDWWGPIIHEYYGSTEMGNVVICNSEEWLAHPGTVGKPIAEATVRVVDEQGRDCAPREIGEVLGRVHAFPDFTYQGDDEKRRRAGKLGLIAPGDIGYLDEDGFLYLCDRSNDMIISGGVNIYPAEIEAELLKLPGVADCAVFAIPDEEYGEAVCAFALAMAGCVLDPAALRRDLRQRLAGFKVPKRIEIADELPREDSGKIFKRKLREPFWAGHERRIA